MTKKLVKNVLQKHLLTAAFAVPAFFLTAVESVEIRHNGMHVNFQSALAQEEEESSSGRQTVRAQAISQRVNNALSKVNEFLAPEEGEPDLAGALRELGEINTSKWNDYEKAQTYRMYGAIYVQQGDYNEAVKWFKRFVDTPSLPENVKLSAMYNLGQLYLATENYKEAVKLLQQYVDSSEVVSASQYFMLGQAYYLNENLPKAIVYVDEAVNRTEAAGKTPTESMYNYQYVLYLGKEDYKKTITILEKLVRLYPKMNHWKTLAGVYASSNRIQDQRAAYEAVYLMGGLTKGSELMLLASLYLEGDYPYKAARIIEKGISQKIVEPTAKNLQTLGTAWQLAKENESAVEIYEQAAKISDDGELYARLTNVYLSTDQLDKAIQSARRALDRKLKKPSDVQMRLGMALFSQNKFEEAVKSFQEARKDKTVAKQASSWIQYTRSEQSRLERLASATQ